MTPNTIGVRETNVAGKDGRLQRAIIITYMVGAYGPFTLQTTQQEIDSGAAQAALQKFAATLGTLPVTQQT